MGNESAFSSPSTHCLVKRQTLTDIASAIRGKTGKEGRISVSDFADEISDISGGGVSPSDGLIFDRCGEDGLPTRITFVGNWTTIPVGFMGKNNTALNGGFSFLMNVKSIEIPDTVTTLNGDFLSSNPYVEKVVFGSGITVFTGYIIRSNNTIKRIAFKGNVASFFYSFYCTGFKDVVFYNHVNAIGSNAFCQVFNCVLYDFSNCTDYTTLGSSTALPHAANCVIRVPHGMLYDNGNVLGWKNRSNWVSLDNVVWEEVANKKITTIDLSSCTEVIALTDIDPYYVEDALPLAKGCVIKVPSSLLTDWQTTEGWSSLTNVVWEGV